MRPLLQSGCHLWRSAPPFDHSKLMTIDGSWSLIGSANWDMRSLRLNFELTVEFYDTDLAGKLAGMIDARCAQPITLEEIDKRPLPVKLRDAAARLAMPYIKESRSLLKVASYNIHRCRGVDGVTRPDRIIGVIREFGADVIALQEVDRRFGRGGGLLDPSAIARETGMRLLVQSDVSHRHGWHGNALLVRGEPISYRRARLKLPGDEPRGAVVAELDLGEGEFRVIAAHLGLFRLSRVDQVSALLTAFRDLPPMPSILLGDLNEWRRRGRSALRGLEPTFGVSPSILSFPSRRPIFALDRILGWPEGLITDLAVHDTPLSRRSSDHLPLTARANLRSAIPALQFAA
jgi:endonuclease/exonuclease/phosphatase family metal-dependent hydrolase